MVQEIWSAEPNNKISQIKSPTNLPNVATSDDEKGRPGPELPSPGHKSPIADVALCHAGQSFLIAGSTDGVITVWR